MSFIRQFFETLFAPVRALLTSPQELLATPKRLLGMSLPARIAVLTFIFLLVCVITAAVAVRFSDDPTIADQPWWRQLPIILVLMCVIPVLTYQALKLWLEGEASAFEDIDKAWAAGLRELDAQGISLAQTPLFLVIGSAGATLEKSLFAATRLNFSVREAPAGPAPLHWYATPDAIYLVCSALGCLGRLTELGEEAAAAVQMNPERPSFSQASPATADIRSTLIPRGGDELRATGPAAVAHNVRESGPLGGSTLDIRGTMMASSASDIRMTMAPKAEAKRTTSVRIGRTDIEFQPLRLNYLCKLIRRARAPLCPINGVLTLLPYNLIKLGESAGAEIQKAVRVDLNTIIRTLKLHCPVTALVVGLESETGFRELVRRVGHERARVQRFGKGFGVWDDSSSEQLGALCNHACGAFEDWVYSLFREKDALSKTGNTQLYALLCKVRCYLKTCLDTVLVGGFAHDGEASSSQERVLFSGCYFAASGETEDRQAFVKSVFDKLVDQQEELEWSEQALRDDRRYRRWAYFGFVLNALLLAVLCGMLAYHLEWLPE